MELQLGLALPSNPIRDFDLNKYENDPPKDETWSTYSCCSSGKNKSQKRSFDDDAFEMVTPLALTLPLLSWNDKPNDEDDGDGDRKSLENSSSCIIQESNGEGDVMVGWPPIKRSRRNLHHLHRHHHHHHQQQRRQNQAGQRRNEVGFRGPISTYVKVKMEGVAIGRKVDLSLHHSYQTLTNTLIAMFGKYEGYDQKRSNDGIRNYTLAYQDRDGDWLLVGDIPWQTFVRCVQRLKILRSGGRLAAGMSC